MSLLLTTFTESAS